MNKLEEWIESRDGTFNQCTTTALVQSNQRYLNWGKNDNSNIYVHLINFLLPPSDSVSSSHIFFFLIYFHDKSHISLTYINISGSTRWILMSSQLSPTLLPSFFSPPLIWFSLSICSFKTFSKLHSLPNKSKFWKINVKKIILLNNCDKCKCLW